MRPGRSRRAARSPVPSPSAHPSPAVVVLVLVLALAFVGGGWALPSALAGGRRGQGPSPPASSAAVQTASYPPVVAQALGDLARTVRALPLGGPTALPPEPPSHTYLTAMTRAGPDGWSVEIVRAAAPYAVDNPAITAPAAHAQAVATFGVALALGPPPRPGAALAAYLWRLDVRAGGLAPDAFATPLPAGAPYASARLGDGVAGELYRAGPLAATLVWREGEWTLVVVASAPATAEAMARAVVAYLHVAFLPPYPGLVAIGVGVRGVVTRVGWLNGRLFYHIEDDLAWGNNPVSACAMAVDWRAR